MSLTNDTNKYWMNEWLEAEMDVVNNEAIPNKWDALILVFGIEGSGKTVFAGGQLAWALKPKYCRLNMDNVVFSPPQFDEAIEKLPDESVIIWDESITGAMSAKGASTTALSIIMKLTQIRKKRLKIILCFPYIDILNRFYINRCLFAVKVYANDFNDRGYFRFYSQPRIEKVYFLAKMQFKYNQYRAWQNTPANFKGRYGEFFPFNEEEYEKKKDEARKWESEQGHKISATDRYMGKILQKVKAGEIPGMTIPKLARMIKIGDSVLYRVLNNYTDSLKQSSINKEGITTTGSSVYNNKPQPDEIFDEEEAQNDEIV